MIEIVVRGEPAPQGSKRHVGRGVMIESSKKVKPWREAVKWAAIEGKHEKIMGPVAYSMTFLFARPKSAKKSALMDKRPDVSKLIRSTEDALTDAGIWEDDARVVYGSFYKAYASEGDNHPGAIICIWEAGDDKRAT